MKHEYTPHGVCARKFEFSINDGKINDLKITGGCSGYSTGMMKMVEGMKADDVIERLDGVRCAGKASSCPAQLALALKEARI
jgi:uncharacterized protein (TIGR03905 family)